MNARHLVLLGGLLTLGCTDPTAPGDLAGTWRQTQTIPGNSAEFTLATNGSVVTGSGDWTGEACCSGTIAVTGEEVGRRVHLTFDFTLNGQALPTLTTRFDGQLSDENTLSGIVTAANQPGAAITFRRVQ